MKNIDIYKYANKWVNKYCKDNRIKSVWMKTVMLNGIVGLLIELKSQEKKDD